MFIKLAYNSSSTQFNLPERFQEDLLAFSNQYISDEDLYTEEEDKGRETEFHITLLYGIDPSEDEKAVYSFTEAFKKELAGPIYCELGKVDKFRKEDYDVLKIEVKDNKLLTLMHDFIKETFKNTSKYPDYHPHIALAYVQKDTCEKLVGDSTFDGKTVKLSKFKYSPAKGEATFLNLKKKAGKVLLTLGQLEEIKQFLMDKLYTLQNRNEIRNIYNYEELTSWLYKNARMKISKVKTSIRSTQYGKGWWISPLGEALDIGSTHHRIWALKHYKEYISNDNSWKNFVKIDYEKFVPYKKPYELAKGHPEARDSKGDIKPQFLEEAKQREKIEREQAENTLKAKINSDSLEELVAVLNDSELWNVIPTDTENNKVNLLEQLYFDRGWVAVKLTSFELNLHGENIYWPYIENFIFDNWGEVSYLKNKDNSKLYVSYKESPYGFDMDFRDLMDLMNEGKSMEEAIAYQKFQNEMAFNNKFRTKTSKIGPAQQEMQNYSGELMDTPQHQALQESEPGKTNVTTEKELTMFPKKKKGNKQYEIILPNHTKALQALNLLQNLQQHKYDFQVENTKFIFNDEKEFKDVQQLFKNNGIMSLSKTSSKPLQIEPHFIKVTTDNLSDCLDYLGYGDETDFYHKTGQNVEILMGDWIDVTNNMIWGVNNPSHYSEIPPYENVFTKEGFIMSLSDYLYAYHNITKTGLNNLKFAIEDKSFHIINNKEEDRLRAEKGPSKEQQEFMKTAISSDIKDKYEELTSKVNKLFQEASAKGWDKDSLAEYNALKAEIDELYTNTLDKKHSSISDKDSNQVASIAVMTDGEILMGKRNDNGKWTLPGGHGKKGENPIENAIRELKEKTGIEAKEEDLTYLGQDTVDADGKQLIIHCFLLNQKEKTNTSHDPDEEVEEWKYIDIQTGSVPQEILSNLHSNPNITLGLLGLQKLENKKSMKKQSMKKQADDGSEIEIIADPYLNEKKVNDWVDDKITEGYDRALIEKALYPLEDKWIQYALSYYDKRTSNSQVISSLNNIFDIPAGITKSAYEKGQDILNKEMPLYVLSRKNKYNDDVFVKEASYDLPALIKKAKYNKDLFISKVAADEQVPHGLASEEFKKKLNNDVQEVVEDGNPQHNHQRRQPPVESKDPVENMFNKANGKPVVLKKKSNMYDDYYAGVTVIIKSGPNKGKKAVIKDVQDDLVSVKLYAEDGSDFDYNTLDDPENTLNYHKKDLKIETIPDFEDISPERIGDDSSSKQYYDRVLSKDSLKFAALGGEKETSEVDAELASVLPFDTHEDGQVEEVINPPIEIENLFEAQPKSVIPKINPEQSSDNIIAQVLNCVNECYPHDLVPSSIWSVVNDSGLISMEKAKLIPILNGVAYKLGLANVDWDEMFPGENNLGLEGDKINLGGIEAQPSVNESQTIQEIFNTNNYDNKAPSLFSIDRIIDERMKLFVDLESLLRESADVISSTMNNVQKSASVMHYKLADVKAASTNRRGQITEGKINYMVKLSSTLDRRLEKQIEVSIPIRGSKVVNPTHFIYAKKEYPLQSWYVNTIMES